MASTFFFVEISACELFFRLMSDKAKSIESVKARWWEESLTPRFQESPRGDYIVDPYEFSLTCVSYACRSISPDKISPDLLDAASDYFEDNVSDARMGKLKKGAKPTEDELELWNSFVENFDSLEMVVIYRGETPHGLDWWVGEEADGHTREQLGMWGPYRSLEEAEKKDQELTGRWSSAHYFDNPGSFL